MLDNDDKVSELALEDRLKAIACQFIALYERWSEDRQVAAKKSFELDEIIKRFEVQVEHFEKLEDQVCQHLGDTIENTTTAATSKIISEILKQTTQAAIEFTQKLEIAADKAEQILRHYEREKKLGQWKVIGVAAAITISTSLLALWLLISKPTLPLSHEDIEYLKAGKITLAMWPKLSKSEKNRWIGVWEKSDLLPQMHATLSKIQ